MIKPNIYTRQGLAQILSGLAAAEASVRRVTEDPSERIVGYHAGALAMLIAVGESVGLEMGESGERVRFLEKEERRSA